MSDHSPFDRYTLPGDIPDAAYWAEGDDLEDAARKRDAACGYSASRPAGRGWVPQSRDLGLPGDRHSFPSVTHEGVEHVFTKGTPDDVVAKLGTGQVFTRERRVRFIDNLAFKGNVRAAAALVGVSHETAYRARRQDAEFAALWEAAMIHARAYAEGVVTTRAFEGVEVAIVSKGEIIGYRTVKDPRWMQMHLARLDRRVEHNREAQAHAARFDELLADYAGHARPDGFAEAAALDPDRGERAPDLPPTREDYVTWCRSQQIGKGSVRTEDARMEAAGKAAGKAWDGWRDGGRALVGAIVEGETPLPQAGGAGGGPVAETPPAPGGGECVTSVNPRARKRGAGLLQTASSAAIQSPYSAGATT